MDLKGICVECLEWMNANLLVNDFIIASFICFVGFNLVLDLRLASNLALFII